MKKSVRPVLLSFFFALLVVAAGARARAVAAPLLTLTPSLPSGQYVGTPITWTVATDETAPVDFSFAVVAPDSPQRLVFDFTTRQTFDWTTIDDGAYTLIATMRNLNTGETQTVSVPYEFLPRATAVPVVTATDNALIALYSAPGCAAGETMRVIFRAVSGGAPAIIPSRPCRPGHSMNFYVAGLHEQTTYFLINQRFDAKGGYLGSSPLRIFTSGVVPLPLPQTVVINPPDAGTSSEDLLYYSLALVGPNWPGNVPMATDLQGNVVWYYEKPMPNWLILFRPTSEGTMLANPGDGTMRSVYWSEFDVAGNIIRETNAHSMNVKLAELGYPPMGVFHHDSRRLPNGYTAVLASTERLMEDVQGPGLVDILGDYVLVFDEQMDLVWVWDSFTHLDVQRIAVLDEKCLQTDDWCVPLFLAEEANDWLHTNTLEYAPEDHSLLLSLRNQDWVVKIDYQDGQGSGDVIWRLGNEGDFALQGGNGDPWPWFSHPHDTGLLANGIMTMYDNGNTRCESGGMCYSRGQVYQLNEQNMTATLHVNADLGYYADGFGSAQRLANGDYFFATGTLPQAPGQAVASERAVDGSENYAIWVQTPVYRIYRLPSMYKMPAGITAP